MTRGRSHRLRGSCPRIRECIRECIRGCGGSLFIGGVFFFSGFLAGDIAAAGQNLILSLIAAEIQGAENKG